MPGSPSAPGLNPLFTFGNQKAQHTAFSGGCAKLPTNLELGSPLVQMLAGICALVTMTWDIAGQHGKWT